MWRRALPVIVLIVAVAGCGGSSNDASPGATGASASAATSASAASVGTPAPEGIDGVLAYAAVDPKTDQSHVNGTVKYPTSPPTRGPHNPVWQNCGYYTKAVVTENAVHALEHGAVWITYTDAVDAAARTTLQALAKANSYVLVTPYPANPAPFVLTAWGRQLKVDAITDPRVQKFIDTYAKDGPTVPELGAPCSGALGIPPDRPSTMAA
jgi:hypothetical protein